MGILELVQTNYSAINGAAGEFVTKLTGTGVVKDVSLAAEMAGLMLLRASSIDLSRIPAGMAVLGATSDDASRALSQFVYGFAMSNGLNPRDLNIAGIPADAKKYLPELTKYEQPFYDVCKKHSIEKQFYPFIAAAAAGKLVLAGNQLGLLDAKIGLALLLFHIAAGSKMVPPPPPGGSSGQGGLS